MGRLPSGFHAFRPVRSYVHPRLPNGKALSVQLSSMKIETVENAPYLVVHLVSTRSSTTKVDQFYLTYDEITYEIVTHAVLVSIRSDSSAKLPPDDPLLLGVIRGEQEPALVDRMRIL